MAAVALWVGRVALVVAAALTVAFDPRVFFGTGQGSGWVSFTSLFHSGSWTALCLTMLGLALLAAAALAGSGGHVGWRWPVLGAGLLVWSLVRGMPHHDNASTWARGAVGAAAWLRAEGAQRARATRPLGAEAFVGVWRAPDGSEWRFTAGGATRAAPNASDESTSAARRAACTGTYRAAYAERGRDVLDGEGVDAFPHAAALLRTMPADARLPVASVACSAEPWSATFVRVRDSELWLLEPWMPDDEMRRGTFVLVRADAPTKGARGA